jgi:DNA helicase II / ATP-dependent DNA helicase PcrA
LSFATSRWKNGKMAYNSKSRFLDEISSAGLQMTQISGKESNQSSRVSLGPPSAHLKAKYAPVSQPTAPLFPDFKPSAIAHIVKGVKVAHERFGMGEVKAVEGIENKIAVILFENPAEGEKRIMLKFARLMVV